MADATQNPAGAAEVEVGFVGPAPFCNRFVVNVAPGSVVRLSFLEGYQAGADTPPHIAFRAAVTLSIGDAIALRDVLTAVIDTEAAAPNATASAES